MATLNKIRAKSGLLIGIIGFALFSFVLGDFIKSGSSFINNDQFVVGVVGGEEVSYKKFNPEVQKSYNYYKKIGMTTISLAQTSEMIWNKIEKDILINHEVEKLGIEIGEDELWHLIITDNSIKKEKSFQTDYGVFDENKVKTYLSTLRENFDQNAQAYQLWLQWVGFEKDVKERAVVSSYYDMIKAGIMATDVEGEYDYIYANNQVNAKYVYLPFDSIKKEEVKVEDAEIKKYMLENKDDFVEEAKRDIQYVYFKVTPSLSDEKNTQEELMNVINDKVKYINGVLDTIPGFASTKNDSLFVNSTSDEKFDYKYYTKDKLPVEIADFAFSSKEGAIYGPYRDGNAIKVSKLRSIKMMPDSVKASHILISYTGLEKVSPRKSRTEIEAKKMADSLLVVLKKDPSKFESIAKKLSDGGATTSKGGDLGWFGNENMAPEFTSYAFSQKKGSIGIAKTKDFGYHIIRIDDRKNINKKAQIATIVRNVLPSDATDNDIYNKAIKFVADNKTLTSFQAAAKAKGYEARNVEGLGKMEYNIPGIESNQRDIIRWTFDADREAGDTKLQALEDGYVAILLYGVSEKGMSSVEVARPKVEKILINKKKADILKAKITGNTLEEIAKNTGVEVKEANSIHLKNTVMPDAGDEPEVVGTLFGMKKDEISKAIVGKTGVFVVKLEDVITVPSLSDYSTYTKKLDKDYKSRVSRDVFEALKNSAEIEDNRAKFY